MQLGTSIIGGELPADAGVSCVALGLQGGDALNQRVVIGDWTREAAALDDADLDLGHIEPTAMFWRIVHLQAAGDSARLRRRERRIERGQGMGVEVILHERDALGQREGFLDQPPQAAGIVQRGTPRGDAYVTPARMRSDQHKEVGRSLPNIFVVRRSTRPGAGGSPIRGCPCKTTGFSSRQTRGRRGSGGAA